jgi:MFS family permease
MRLLRSVADKLSVRTARSTGRAERVLVLFLPFVDVLAEIGMASAFPQFRDLYGSAFRASVLIAASPLFAMLAGWSWGWIAARWGLRSSFRVTAVGWSVSTMLVGFTLEAFSVALAIRVLQGVFSGGIAALPFIRSMERSGDETVRARHFGYIETAVSLGAILGPLVIGATVANVPQLGLGGTGAATLLVWLALELSGDYLSGTERKAESAQRQTSGKGRTHIALDIAFPTAVAAIVGLLLAALETLIPTLGEDYSNSVLFGKGVTVVFEVAVVIGIILKSRRPGLMRLLPIPTITILAAAYLTADVELTVLVLLAASGVPIGALVVLGNELASVSVRGFEQKGMGAYSTLRISGSFLGPLCMNFGYPLIVLVLTFASLMCLPLILYQYARIPSE